MSLQTLSKVIKLVKKLKAAQQFTATLSPPMVNMMLNDSPCMPVNKPLHTAMQQCIDSLCTTQQQMNLTTALLQGIPTFHGWDTTKLGDWLSNIETAAIILKERCACLTEAKSFGLTHTLVCEALYSEKCRNDIRDILHLKHCNVNIHTYTSHFMETQQRDNETLAAYVHHFKMETKRSDFNSDTANIHIFVKGLWDAHNITAKVYEKDPQILSEVTKLVKKLKAAQQFTATLSPLQRT